MKTRNPLKCFSSLVLLSSSSNMDLKNLISSDDGETKPRLSIHNLMNDDPTPKEVPIHRSSISSITNDEDVDMTAPEEQLPKEEPKEATPEAKEDGPAKTEKPKKTAKAKASPKPKRTAKPSKKAPRPTKKTTKPAENATKSVKKPTTIEQDIHKLEELQHEAPKVEPKSDKPKRYAEKPVWAKDYIPKVANHHKVSLANPTKLSVPSINGSIPRNDFNKLVTEWIWANVEGVKREYVEIPNAERYIELELKLGNIWDKVKDRRVSIPVNTETVVGLDFIHQDCFFKSGITVMKWKAILEYLQKLAHESQSAKRKDSKFIVESSHNVDLMASEKKRNDRLVSTRVTLDVKTKRRVTSIEKLRVSDLFIYMPNTLFDMRLSMSLELPKEMNDPAFEAFEKRVSLRRDKDRKSYIHGATATRIDVTKVKESDLEEPKYELELEMNNRSLLRSMSRVQDDPLYYVDLVQAFLDNGRIVSRYLS